MTNPPADIEPLEDELWLAAVERLSQRQADGDGGSVESLLRHAFHLLQLAPLPVRPVARCELEEEAFERLLESGAFESAAIALVAPPAGFTLGRTGQNGQGHFEATVRFSDPRTQPVEASSESAARSLLGAWTTALMQRSLEDLASRPARHRPPA